MELPRWIGEIEDPHTHVAAAILKLYGFERFEDVRLPAWPFFHDVSGCDLAYMPQPIIRPADALLVARRLRETKHTVIFFPCIHHPDVPRDPETGRMVEVEGWCWHVLRRGFHPMDQSWGPRSAATFGEAVIHALLWVHRRGDDTTGWTPERLAESTDRDMGAEPFGLQERVQKLLTDLLARSAQRAKGAPCPICGEADHHECSYHHPICNEIARCLKEMA